VEAQVSVAKPRLTIPKVPPFFLMGPDNPGVNTGRHTVNVDFN
jgi:hypothetical protein